MKQWQRGCGLVIGLVPAILSAQSKPSITVGPNVHVSVDHAADGASESWLTADPKDPRRLLACTIIYPTGENRRYTAVYLSVDRGRSWKPVLSPKEEGYVDAADPACVLGPGGTASYVELAFKDFSSIEANVYKSMDGGETWTRQPAISVKNTGIDRESLVADATGGVFNGRVYITGQTQIRELDKVHSARNGIGVWTSRDSGATFSGPALRASPQNRYASGFGNSVILADGTLLTLFAENINPDSLGRSTAPPNTPSAVLEIAASHDGGETYDPAIRIADKYASSAKIGSVDVPSLAAYPGSAAFAGNVYAVWTDGRSGVAQIFMSRSTDSGKTWSRPVVVNDVLPHAKEMAGPNVFSPNVAVNREGVVLVTWYDRNNTPGNTGWHLRARPSLDGGETWLPSSTVSSAPNAYGKSENITLHGAVTGGGAREWWARGGEMKLNLAMQIHEFWAADYSGLVADAGGVFHALWTDNRSGMPQLWTASIEVAGEVARNGDSRLASLDDISSKVALQIVGTHFDRASGKAEMTVRLINTSNDTLHAPIKVRALSISSAMAETASATNSSNGIAGSGAVWDFASLPGGVLPPQTASGLQPMNFILKQFRPLYGEDGLHRNIVEMRLVVLGTPVK
jgi:hypothetical protein